MSALITESPIKSVGTPTTVSVSQSAWTRLPAGTNLAGRSGLIISNPGTNTTAMVAHIGGLVSTAIATTVRPIEIAKGGFVVIPLADNEAVWALTLHVSAENLHVQEFKQ